MYKTLSCCIGQYFEAIHDWPLLADLRAHLGSRVTVVVLHAGGRGTCGVESVVVASGREMLVRLGLCRVGVR